MYVIIETGGKQYKIKKGDIIEVDLLKEEKEVKFSNVLLLNTGSSIKIGTPHLENCYVTAEVIEQIKGPKVISYKYKRRKNYKRKKGHRQKYTKVKITEIKYGT